MHVKPWKDLCHSLLSLYHPPPPPPPGLDGLSFILGIILMNIPPELMDKHDRSTIPQSLFLGLSPFIFSSFPPPISSNAHCFFSALVFFFSWVGGSPPVPNYHISLYPPSVVKVLTLLVQHMIIPIILITSLILFGHNINFTAFSILYST